MTLKILVVDDEPDVSLLVTAAVPERDSGETDRVPLCRQRAGGAEGDR